MAARDLLPGPPPGWADFRLEAGKKGNRKAVLGAASPRVAAGGPAMVRICVAWPGCPGLGRQGAFMESLPDCSLSAAGQVSFPGPN